MPVNLLVHRSITAILWAVMGSAFLGSFLFLGFRIATLVVTMGMSCDSCADPLQVFGALSVGLMMLVGAMVLIVWHVDRWPYKAAAPVMLAVAIGLAPSDIRYHWFWWLGA